MHRFFHVCSVSVPQMFLYFLASTEKNPFVSCLFPIKKRRCSMSVVSNEKMPASKDMSQGSQVPIPEEANALQSFMQNNVARNAVKLFRSGVDGLANFKNLKTRRQRG